MAAQLFDVKKGFGVSVRAWRSKRGISQEELADRADLHRTYVCDVERGTRNVTLQSIEKLAYALEISIPTLLSYDHEALPDKPTGRKKHSDNQIDILYVEDNPTDVELARQGLKNITNRIHVVHDGLAALHYLSIVAQSGTRKHNNLPQLILLDLGLPKMNGIEVLRRIKADARTARIHVVVLTASALDRDLQSCKKLGAAAYIVKPVDLQNLSQITPQLNLQWALLRSPATPARASLPA